MHWTRGGTCASNFGVTHPSLEKLEKAKDGVPTFEGESRFLKLRVGHLPLWCIVLRDGCTSEICIEDSIWGGSYC